MKCWSLTCGGLLLVSGCNRAHSLFVAPPDEVPAEADAGPSELPPRCALGKAALGIPHDPAAGDLELGEGAPYQRGFAVGAIRGVGPKRVASVVQIEEDLSRLSVVDLGTPRGDTPPPHPFTAGDALYAAYYPARTQSNFGPSSRDATLNIAVARIRDGRPETLVAIPTGKADSLEFDVAVGANDGILAWDEDDAKTHRGVLQVVRLSLNALNAPATAPMLRQTIASDGADAESPRVMPRAGGYWLVWAARKPDELDAGIATASAQGNRWLEAAPLDEQGRRAGPNRRLSPLSGHIASFSLVRVGATDMDVVARDEVDGADPQSARAVRVRVRGDSSSSPDVLVAANVGRGVPDVLLGKGSPARGWLSFVDGLGNARLVPLGANLDATGGVSPEPTLDESRAVSVLSAGPPFDRVLVLSPFAAASAVRLVECGP